MNKIKHFMYFGKLKFKQMTCKHLDSSISSCPFTERTYTTCLLCFKQLNVEVTK